ncbi:MAG: ROK family protein [Pirellulaceae bacterium]
MPRVQEGIPVERAQRPFFVGVDVGGTNTKIGVLDNDGVVLGKTSIATLEERGPGDSIARDKAAIDSLLSSLGISPAEVVAVGLGTPGTQDIPRGMILEPPNMPHWRHYPVRDRLGEACGKPCYYANDANAAAYGEFWVGSGRSYKSMVMFTLGTGVGGGIILNGVSVDGEHSFGSELGHLVIDCRDDARLCVWGGGRGELEAYASASAVVARARDALAAGRDSSVHQRLEQGDELTSKVLFEEAEAGDVFSLDIILDTARYLGVGITNVVHSVDPGVVVIGGAMTFGGHQTRVGRRFLDEVRSEFQRRAFNVVGGTVIDYASLGGDAGFIGAAGIAHSAWHRERTR